MPQNEWASKTASVASGIGIPATTGLSAAPLPFVCPLGRSGRQRFIAAASRALAKADRHLSRTRSERAAAGASRGKRRSAKSTGSS